MQLVVLADDDLKKELMSQGIKKEAEIVWIKHAEDFTRYKNADGFMDLLFADSPQRVEWLRDFSSKTVIINSVITTLHEINAPFIRINAWPGFLKRPVMEASNNDEDRKRQAEKIFSIFNKKTTWVADETGFVTARVIAMIINEAWFALGENVSTKEEIDTAMKLGTNYPHGPFEWCTKIGMKNIYDLLNRLSKNNTRYKPAPLLEKQVVA